MRKFLVLAGMALAVAGCADKQKLNTALANAQKLSAEKDSLLSEVLANTQMVTQINTELASVKGLGANPVSSGEAGMTAANADRAVVVGKIRDVISRLNESEAQLARTKQRLVAVSGRDSKLVKQVSEYQQQVADMKAQLEQQQAQYLAVIDSQKTQIVALHATVDTVSAQKAQVEAVKTALADTLNTVYYVAGTKDDLIHKGVAVNEGSKFLFFGGKKLMPSRDLAPTMFTTANRVSDTVITLPDSTKTYKIVSRQDPEVLSATPTRDGKPSVEPDGKVRGGQIHIAQPDKFWAASKYLILVQD